MHKQLIGRLRRRCQKDVVDAIYTHANGGSDPIIVEMLGLKSSQSHGVVDPGQSAPVRVTDETRLIRLAQMVLQPKS